MGLGGCYSIIKYFLVIFNLIFLIAGITGVIFSIWMLVDPTFSVSLTQESSDYIISIVIILVASILLVIVACLGIYGALKEHQCALLTFFSVLLIIFVAELSAGLWGYINSESLAAHVHNAMKQTVQEEYYTNDNRKSLFDSFQGNLHCCGVDGPADWLSHNKRLHFNVGSGPEMYNISQSCCHQGVSLLDCRTATQNVKVSNSINYHVVYKTGCYELIINKLQEYGCILFGIGIGILSVQILGLIFSLVLAFAVNKTRRYKA